MSALSDYAELKVLDVLTGRATFTAPSAVYLALGTGDFTDTGTAVSELSGNGYTRIAITFGSAAASGEISNTAAITFPAATGNQDTISHWKIMDASTGGNCLMTGAFSASKTIETNDVLQIAIGDLDLTAS